MKIEVDFTQTIEAFEKLGKSLRKFAEAWGNSSLKELRKLFNEINFQESNNSLKYHKKSMRRNRWLK